MDAINDQSPFKTELERQKWMLENMTKDRDAFEKKADKYAEQIRELGDYILDNDLMPKGFEGGAIKCAIQIIEQAQAELEQLRKQDELSSQMYDSLGGELAKLKNENNRYRQALELILERSKEALDEMSDDYGMKIGLLAIRERAYNELNYLIKD